MWTNRKYVQNNIIMWLLMFIWIIGTNNQVAASGSTESGLPQKVIEADPGIIKLLLYAVDQNGNEYYVKQGTGILIEIGDGEKIVLANDKFVQTDEELINKIRRQYGLSAEGDLNIETDIVLQVGTRIRTETGSSGEDFVILNLANNINNVKSLGLGNSSSVKKNDKIYISGYSGNSDILGRTEIGDFDLQKNVAQVTSVTEDEIVTDYPLEGISPGIPVLNAEGYIVGIIAIKETEVYIKPIDKVKKILDVLNIRYQGEEGGNHYNEVTEEIRIELNQLLLECEDLVMKGTKYTKKSVQSLKSAIAEAIKVTVNTEATYDDYQQALEQLLKYKGKLRKKEYPVRMLQIGMCIAIIVFILLSIRIKMQIKRLKTEGNIGIGEEKNPVIYAKLIRLDTMQEIPISNVIFRIGQNLGDIDYAVADNTSVSRHHADIMRKGNEFFILDNNSTNHTFVNEKQAMPGEYVPIKGGDIIRLSDVSFRFEV